jgi:hypothetical protein
MTVRIGFITAVLLALLCVATPPLSAHHGWGGQQEQESSMTGVVTEAVSLAGPLATMKIRVDQQVWDVTLAPANRTSGAGLRENTLRVGDTVTVYGHRNSDMKRFEIKTERVVHNGKTYAVYANR